MTGISDELEACRDLMFNKPSVLIFFTSPLPPYFNISCVDDACKNSYLSFFACGLLIDHAMWCFYNLNVCISSYDGYF